MSLSCTLMVQVKVKSKPMDGLILTEEQFLELRGLITKLPWEDVNHIVVHMHKLKEAQKLPTPTKPLKQRK